MFVKTDVYECLLAFFSRDTEIIINIFVHQREKY